MLTAHAVRDLRRATRVWAALTKGAVLSLGPAPASASAASGDGVPEPDSATARLALRVVDDGAGADADADADADATSSSSSAVLVLPADVLAVVLSVVGHRLALRRPEDEKSLFWGSEVGALRGRRGGGGGEGEGGERGLGQVVTVEAVVREVVAVV
ncbi:uncharacterized protein RHOBADRAFT_55323 [Rhodotorula graminis WP1]|uniref:Uncharacterized protein n=1 Tax=Rhodotorula graminis (strain WP1) TaxID=578459 RepID=A0A0P9GJC4_RHOGW|nr:uncharacterized protein RHOBADRAFT_55323 [Rhodotorula graminis WP1]KPV73102.1 hypothetical protein RHOBADRAFT_55323 [Rhodotorula graminis WP1]